MTIKELQQARNTARLNGDTVRLGILNELIGAVEKLGIDKGRKDYPSEIVDSAIAKEQKIAQGMIDTCPVTRPDLAAQYQTRLSIINEYMPKLLTENEIQEQVKAIFDSNPSLTNMGAAMKVAAPLFRGKADMSIVSKTIKAHFAKR